MYERNISLHRRDLFSPLKTFDCGQAFRFEENEDFIEGVASGALIRIKKEELLGKITYSTNKKEGLDHFFDPDNSYSEMSEHFLQGFESGARRAIEDAIAKGFGIRILRQDFFEALISFIISQNNNIPRIKKNVFELSKKFGEKFEVEGKEYYSFPTPEALLWAGETGLNECRLGFRVKYILDATRKVLSGEVNEKELLTLDDESALKKLQEISGVGPKVASCVLLYSLGRHGAVPVDVWMKKIFAKYFDTTPETLGVWGGVLQQYLFYNERFVIEGK